MLLEKFQDLKLLKLSVFGAFKKKKVLKVKTTKSKLFVYVSRYSRVVSEDECTGVLLGVNHY